MGTRDADDEADALIGRIRSNVKRLQGVRNCPETRQLAKRSKVPESTVWRILNDEGRYDPRISSLVGIANGLDVSVEDLIRDPARATNPSKPERIPVARLIGQLENSKYTTDELQEVLNAVTRLWRPGGAVRLFSVSSPRSRRGTPGRKDAGGSGKPR